MAVVFIQYVRNFNRLESATENVHSTIVLTKTTGRFLHHSFVPTFTIFFVPVLLGCPKIRPLSEILARCRNSCARNVPWRLQPQYLSYKEPGTFTVLCHIWFILYLKYMRPHVCVCVCVRTYSRIFYLYIYIYCEFVYTICVYTVIHTYGYTYVCIRIYIYIYMYVYIYIYVCVSKSMCV